MFKTRLGTTLKAQLGNHFQPPVLTRQSLLPKFTKEETQLVFLRETLTRQRDAPGKASSCLLNILAS